MFLVFDFSISFKDYSVGLRSEDKKEAAGVWKLFSALTCSLDAPSKLFALFSSSKHHIKGKTWLENLMKKIIILC